MCYSILVETDLSKLANEFGAEIDVESFWTVYQARGQGEKLTHIPRALDNHFKNDVSILGNKIWNSARKFIDDEVKRHQDKVEEKEILIDQLGKKLETKHTKTNQNKFETANRILGSSIKKIERLQGPVEPDDQRLLPNSYGPLIVNEHGTKKIKLSRYRIRPAKSTHEFPNKYNMFNIRSETIEARNTWKHLFGRNHGMVVMHGFYEWVPDLETGKSREIHFFPKDNQWIWAPAFFDEWQSYDKSQFIHSFAIITRDPPEAIKQFGHDRCPIFPNWNRFNDFLDTTNPKEIYFNVFNDLKPTEYKHFWVA